MISNLSKQNGEKNSQNIRKRKWWKKYNGKIENSGKIKSKEREERLEEV